VRSGLRVLLAGAGAVAALAVVAPPPASAQPGLGENAVTVVVRNLAPSTPVYTDKPSPLTIVLALTNTTDQALYNVNIGVDRDAPVSQQKQLEQLMAKPAPGPGLARRRPSGLSARAGSVAGSRLQPETLHERLGRCRLLRVPISAGDQLGDAGFLRGDR
jgi:hypothetical protein